MAVRYFVEDSSLVLKSVETDDDAVAPTGETAILRSVIEGFYDGPILLTGTLDSVTNPTTYTPPADYVAPYDPTSDSGMVKDAAHAMLDVFDVALALIHENRAVWPDAARAIAVDGIHWQIVNSARVALNATRTAARRQKFCEESASWPDGTNGNVVDYVDVIAASDSLTTPTKDWSWVDPESDPYMRFVVSGAATRFMSATNVENAPSSAGLIGRGWIANIP